MQAEIKENIESVSNTKHIANEGFGPSQSNIAMIHHIGLPKK